MGSIEHPKGTSSQWFNIAQAQFSLILTTVPNTIVFESFIVSVINPGLLIIKGFSSPPLVA